MATVTLFKNSHGNCGCPVTMPGGAIITVPFVSGKFFTTDTRLEAVLNQLAEHREMGIYVDTKESDIDPECATPIEQMKRKLREELIAEMKASGEMSKDFGTSDQKSIQQSLTNSTGIVGAAELTSAETALKQKQIEELNNPQTANKTLSTAELLAKAGK